MGLFNRFSKQKKEEQILKQDLSQKEDNNRVFIMHLLMKEKISMPSKENMVKHLRNHLGDIDCFSYSEKNAGFAVKKYQVEFQEGKIPPQLLVLECLPTEGLKIDPLFRSQMWSCPESGRILDDCKFHVVCVDMMANLLPYRDRAEMNMDCLEALMEVYPQCEAVYFQTSGKMFTRKKIISHDIPREDRFIYFAVNARFFNIQGTNDHIVDTLGMSILGLPDLQYHFHDIDPNWVVNHAYNTAAYIYSGQKVIENGDCIDGIRNGIINMDIQWKCHHENSLIQPLRPVIDICMNEYASGSRKYDS